MNQSGLYLVLNQDANGSFFYLLFYFMGCLLSLHLTIHYLFLIKLIRKTILIKMINGHKYIILNYKLSKVSRYRKNM